MKGNIAGIVMVLCFAGTAVCAQQKLDPGGMNYIISTKPNNIIYRDTLYKGSAQFMRLFYRTHDQELIGLYRNHQTNKIAGQVLSIAGTLV
ncbi:MAG: hypothetical protein JWQ78_1813, partial [Sediminibacterium sp.]|nr:hypothetical protein [Sediminibacterium sp.]